MPTPTHAEQMVTAIKAELLKHIGIRTGAVGGNSITYIDDLERKLAYWEKRVAIEAGTFNRSQEIYLGGD